MDYDEREEVMRDADATLALALRLIEDDDKANAERARVRGLIDGNSPYSPEKLRKAGRADACNVNWRVAEAYVDSAKTAYYDLMAEAPTFAEATTDYGPTNRLSDYSRIITHEFDRLQRKMEHGWDHALQVSQFNMLVYGTGPMLPDHPLDWRFKAIPSGDLKVPRGAESTVDEWDLAVVLTDYLPHNLWRFISDPEAAKQVGWQLGPTRDEIINSQPDVMEDEHRKWEWHQAQLKANSYSYSYRGKVIKCARVYAREKPREGEDEGRISMCIIPIRTGGQTSSAVEFLFKKRGIYANWRQAIHPFYFDQGMGFHHHVRGIGVKMYAAMEYDNRLLCNLADKAFAPKILLQPTVASESEKLQIANFGDYAMLPANLQVHQSMLNGMLEEGLTFHRELAGQMSSNLSMYRQNLQRETGNPITATETQYRAGEQARLSGTQLNRYYEQLDWLFQEKYRRAINPHLSEYAPGGKAALEFQRRCERQGVPRESLRRAHVRATRIVGNGSVFLRQQALDFLLQLVPMLPESGRVALVKDAVAARAGRAMVTTYYPTEVEPGIQDQLADAILENAALAQGAPLMVTDNQNHAIHSGAHVTAMQNAVQSIPQGADPGSVLTFLNAGITHTDQHMQRMTQDQTRKTNVDQLTVALKELQQTAQAITQQLQQQAQQQQQAMMMQQQAQAVQQGMDPDTQLKAAKLEADIANKTRKTDFQLADKARKSAQDMMLKDARTAADIARQGAGNGDQAGE